MSTAASVHAALLALLEGPLAEAQFELVDVECLGLGTAGATVRVFVELAQDHPVGGRIDLDQVSQATAVVDALLEADDVVGGRFTLEVSSPGLERPLRTPEHFRRAVGSMVRIKTQPGTPGERRVEGRLDEASTDSDGSVRVGGRTIAYADIESARIVVAWGPPPKPKAPRTPHPMAAKSAAGTGTVPDGQEEDDDDLDEFGEELDDDDFDDDDLADDEHEHEHDTDDEGDSR
jgi:ribosome maturation factor RimP